MRMTTTNRPRFTGARIYNDPGYQFSFWYPHTWHVVQSAAGRVIIAPVADQIATSFSVEVIDLGMASTPEDLPLLREGIEESLKQLDMPEIDRFQVFDEGDRFGFDLHYTFGYGGVRARRRSLLYYQGSAQYSLIAQGATIEAFDYWLPMFAYMMLTCKAGGFDLRAWAEAAADEQNPSAT
jgi:hypothetical protein